MKKKVKFLCLFMVMLLSFSLVSVMGTSAASYLKNTVDFELEASFNSITIKPPTAKGEYIYYLTFDEAAGRDMEEIMQQTTDEELVFEAIDSTMLFTEEGIEYFACDGTYDEEGFLVTNLIEPGSKYYVLLLKLDTTGDLAVTKAYGGKWITTPDTPEAYKGYEGYMQNTVDFEVIPGVDTLTLEPVSDTKAYVVSVVENTEGVTLGEFEEGMGFYPTGAIAYDSGMLVEAECVAETAMSLDGESVDIKPNTEYIVTYFMLDSDTFPARVVTYGAKIVKTVESLDVYEGSDKYIVVMDGDTNLDEEVNIKDATAIQKHIAKTELLTDSKAIFSADTTGDGELNVKDATLIQKHLAKMEVSTSIGKQIPVKK